MECFNDIVSVGDVLIAVDGYLVSKVDIQTCEIETALYFLTVSTLQSSLTLLLVQEPGSISVILGPNKTCVKLGLMSKERGEEYEIEVRRHVEIQTWDKVSRHVCVVSATRDQGNCHVCALCSARDAAHRHGGAARNTYMKQGTRRFACFSRDLPPLLLPS